MKIETNLGDVLNKFKKKIEDTIAIQDQELDSLLETTAKSVRRSARTRVPKKTRNLQKSIKMRKVEDGYEVYVDLVQAPYGIFVERGTRKMAARAFMEPAALKAFPTFRKKLKELVKGKRPSTEPVNEDGMGSE